MRENFNMLDWDGKDRIIKFTFITVLAAVMAVGYAFIIYGLFKGYFYNPDDVLEAILYFVPYLVFMFFVMIAGPVIILIIDLLAYGIFSTEVFRKTNFVSEAEYILTNQVFTVVWIAGIVISFIILFCCVFLSELSDLTSGIDILSSLISLAWTMCPSLFPLFFGYLFYIYPLKHKRHERICMI